VTMLGIDAAILIAGFALNLVVHECAHVAVARVGRRRIVHVSLGVGPTLLTTRCGGTTVSLGPLPLAGYVVWHTQTATPALRVAVAFGGPVATLLLALALWKSGVPSLAFTARTLGAMGVLGLIPGLPGSDGDNALRAPTERRVVARRDPESTRVGGETRQ
jgi:membrane-associated protease RseP (regulator of RpoE activity)